MLTRNLDLSSINTIIHEKRKVTTARRALFDAFDYQYSVRCPIKDDIRSMVRLAHFFIAQEGPKGNHS